MNTTHTTITDYIKGEIEYPEYIRRLKEKLIEAMGPALTESQQDALNKALGIGSRRIGK